MAKKSTTRPVPPVVETVETTPVPSFLLNKTWVGLAVAALAALLYANTVGHGFVLDDGMLILDNAFTKKGVAGWGDLLRHDTFAGYFEEMQRTTTVYGSRYRPLTLLVFAFFYQVFGSSPLPFHLLCVAAYAGVCLLLYRTVGLFLKEKFSPEKTAWISAAAALLFAAHPVHTEVVANIKSLDETAALALGLGAMNLALQGFDRKKAWLSALAALLMFVGMLAKENVLTLLAVFPAALLLFRNASLPVAMKSTGLLAAGVAAGILVRTSVVGWGMGEPTMELVNNPFVKLEIDHWVDFTPKERAAAVLAGLWKDAQLLVFPHPLTSDYYPRQLGMVTFKDWRAWAGLLVFVPLLVFALGAFWKKTRPVGRLGVLFFLAALSITSNIFFQVGTHLAERFLFMPSAGFCLAVAGLGWSFYQKGWKKVVLGAFATVLLLFSAKTVWRNTFWQSNRTLFYEDIKVSANSVKMREAIAPLLLGDAIKVEDPSAKQALVDQAIGHLDAALKMHPTMVQAYYDRGNARQISQQYDLAVADYRKALLLDPNFLGARNNLTFALREQAKQEARKEAAADNQKIIELLTESDRNFGGRDQETTAILAQAHVKSGDWKSAVPYFERLLGMMPGNAQVVEALAHACEMSGDRERAAEVRKTGK